MNIRVPRKQSGVILIVAIVLLLLLSVVTFFAVKVGLADQRDATADARAKIAHRVAEAGLDQAVEYLRLNSATLLPSAGVAPGSDWTSCSATDQTFPCGAIDPASSNSSTRALYYAYTAGVSDGHAASPSQVDTRSLKMGQSFTTVGNFPVTYNVGAVLCMIDKNSVGSGKTANCTSSAGDSDRLAVVLVSTGQIDGESARATISEAMAQYKVLNTPNGLPPVVSSSIISGLGNGTIVPNPNSGGKGVPLSVWTRDTLGDVGDTASGSFQTCQADEYFRSGSTSEVWSNGAVTCTDCACASADELSKNGTEGKDMLDRDDTDSGTNQATDTVLSPSYQFPCDLFAYVFGVTAREDKVSTDKYADAPPLCETQTDADGNGTADVVDFLSDTNNFTEISDCQDLVQPVGSGTGGFYWVPSGNCSPNATGDIGSPTDPVVIVTDCSFKDTGPTIYGLVFVRDTSAVYGDGSCAADADAAGAADYEAGGGTATIYGAVVIEGPGKLNGGLDIISSPAILSQIVNSDRNLKFARVPGTWNDSLTY